MLGSICDPWRTQFTQALFPKLPTFAAAIPGIPTKAPFTGSCAQAVCLGEIVTAPDVAIDIRFDQTWKRLCVEHGVLAIQSRPIYVHGKPLGTFVLAFREVRSESDWDAALMKFAADSAGAELEKVFAAFQAT